MPLLSYNPSLKLFNTAIYGILSNNVTSTASFGGAMGWISQPRKQNKKEGVWEKLEKNGE